MSAAQIYDHTPATPPTATDRTLELAYRLLMCERQ